MIEAQNSSLTAGEPDDAQESPLALARRFGLVGFSEEPQSRLEHSGDDVSPGETPIDDPVVILAKEFGLAGFRG